MYQSPKKWLWLWSDFWVYITSQDCWILAPDWSKTAEWSSTVEVHLQDKSHLYILMCSFQCYHITWRRRIYDSSLDHFKPRQWVRPTWWWWCRCFERPFSHNLYTLALFIYPPCSCTFGDYSSFFHMCAIIQSSSTLRQCQVSQHCAAAHDPLELFEDMIADDYRTGTGCVPTCLLKYLASIWIVLHKPGLSGK